MRREQGGFVHLGEQRNHHLLVTTYLTVDGEQIWQDQVEAVDESEARRHAARLLGARPETEGAVIDKCWEEVVEHDGGIELFWREYCESLEHITRTK